MTHVRAEWIAACAFHDLSDAEVLREVARRVQAWKSKEPPVILLDLDSTLYEVGPRTFQILKEWMESSDSRKHPQVRASLERLGLEHVGYSIRDTLLALGHTASAVDGDEMRSALSDLKQFWGRRFFTSDYLKYDHAYPGAARFAQKVYELGAHLIYLTGRDEPGMGHGTRQNLLRDGFPWEVERTELLLKRNSSEPDLEHKREARHAIRKTGHLIASFENEPPNIVALYDLFPDAMHIFVETVFSDHPAEAREGLYRIRGFKSF